MSENNNELQKNTINLNNLPKIDTNLNEVSAEYLTGYNDVQMLVKVFRQYLDVSKRINSENTKRAYCDGAKQFLIWCNKIKLAIKSITKTKQLQNLVITYQKALDSTDFAQNSKALKQRSIKKFFDWYNFMFPDYNINVSSCFSSDWTSSADPNAFKRQTRINEEVFNAIKEQVYLGDINDKWIFFFLAFGCRRSEICTIKIKDLDFLNKEINIYQHKQGNNKKIPLPDWANENSINRSSVYLIYNTSDRSTKTKGIKPVTPQYIYLKINRWIKQTSFKNVDITPHSFRRYFVSSLLKKGHSDSNISKLGGWSNTAMIFKYGYDAEMLSNPIIKNNEVKY